MAIILDQEYLDARYDAVYTEVQVIIERILREDLKNGGLYVTYYSWTAVNLKKDYMAVLTVTNCDNTWKVFREARAETLLLMALTDPDCPRLPPEEAIMIPITSGGEELPQVLLDLKSSQALRWKSSIVLHDDTFARDMISRVAIAVTTESPDGYVKPMSVSLFKIRAHIQEWERRKSIRRTLLNLPTNYIGRNFLAIVTTTIMENIMEVAKDLGLVEPFSQWMYVISDTNSEKNNISSVLPLIGEGENVAFAYNVTDKQKDCKAGVQCHCGELLRSFVLALSRMIREEKAVYGQISDEEWETIRPSKKERRDSLLETMVNQLKTSSVCSNCTTWKIQTAEFWGTEYQTNADSKWSTVNSAPRSTKFLDVGTWKPNDGVQLNDVLFPHVSNGFRRKNLHIVTYHNPPWQIIAYNESGVPGVMRGVVMDILNEMAKKLNFTYTMHIIPVAVPKANDTEELSYNSTEEGQLPTTTIPLEILNLVSQDKVFLAAVGATVNEKYKRFINYSIPISIQPYNFIVSRPRELSRLYLFMAPFTTETWLCLAACLVIMGPLLYLINRFSPFYEHKGYVVAKLGLNRVNNCFWYIYGALLQQGGMYLPQADSGRIIIGTWWLVVIVLVTTYCGNLVAFLTFPKIEIPITTIGQLVNKRSFVSWSTKSGSFLEEFLAETDEPKYKRLLDGMEFQTEATNEIIESVRQGKHVYIDWKSNLQYIMKREFLVNDRCDFALGVEDFLDEQIAIILPRGSAYLNLINAEITRLHQMGFIQRWLKEYLPKKDRCWNVGKAIEVNNHTVNLDDMQGSFLVLFIGCVLGACVIILECMWFKRREIKEQVIIKPFVK
ncbi:ionotropic receptor 93a [Phlebotomus argentipes]|uniref:ionotropic receptor 93a n=1 Tax=Phlebotomus argentipes TaxID=94469 RepID=UPI002893102E|nr:ionotropic receptor 93a [Phlebotomus argentipes]